MNTAIAQKFWLFILTAAFVFNFLLTHKRAVAQLQNENVPSTLGRPKRTVQSGTRIRLNLPKLGAPGRRVPGGSRGQNCAAKNQRLTALLPKSNLGLTTVANPTLYFYIPQNTAPTLELVIQNENQEIYKQNYKLISNAGIVGISLPNNTLSKGKTYKWNFSIICNPQDRSLDKSVEGTIQLVNIHHSLISKLERATPQERLRFYAESGIWYDALDILARLRYSKPNDLQLKADWEYLLTAPGVELDKKLLQQPLIFQQEALQQLKSYK